MTVAVERVSLIHLQIPLKEPARTPGAEVLVKDAILVQIETASGSGYGECSPPGVSPGGQAATAEACWDELSARIVPGLLGRSFTTPQEIADLASGWSGCAPAVAGAETACWDLLARSRHAPIADLLGASPEQAARGVESGLTVGRYPTIVELLRAIETHLVEGYRRVKIEIRPGEDVELVRAVRTHFGDLPLMVDAGEAYTAADLDVFRELDGFDLLMVERPIAASDLDGLAALQSAISTPVCLDAEPRQTLDAVGRGACRVVKIKIQQVGGFGPAQAIHDACFRRGVACWVGTTPELGVGQAQGIHLAALGNCKYPTDIEPSARWFVDDYVVPLIELTSPGILGVPTRPGLGFEIDHAKVKHYQVRREDFGLRTLA